MYRHRQTGLFLIVVLVVFAAIALVAGYALVMPGAYAIALLFFVTAVAFAQLTIDVDAKGVRWAMTFGFPGSYVPFDRIANVSIIPVSFWYGIGVHLTMRGWVWNVALGRGVQIERRGTLPIVLGTDDPEGLLAAIERARAA
jgi:hypothetical protein